MDYITAGAAGLDECHRNCQIITSMCELLGVLLASEKCEGPQTCMEYLGFELDTIKGEIRLPEEKLQRLETLLESWEGKKSCTKHKLESLIGQLQHATNVMKPGRSFLRRMIVLAKLAQKPWHHICINAPFKADLAWWKTFLRTLNGISMMSMLGDQAPGGAVTSDASGSWECGAYSGSQWLQLQWNHNLQSKSIAVKGMVPIIIATAIWGRSWKGKLIICHCDNQSVVAVINSRYSQDDELMQLLHTLFFFEAIFEFHMEASHIHISRVHNKLADALSRDKFSSFLPKAWVMEQSPSPIPAKLLELIQDMQIDWTSAAWRDIFNSILTKV